MNCQETTWLVSDAQERELSAMEKDRLAEHIGSCPYCSKASVQFEVLFRQIGVYFGRRSEDDGPGAGSD